MANTPLSFNPDTCAGNFTISDTPALTIFNAQPFLEATPYMAWRGAGDDDSKIYYAWFNGSAWSDKATPNDSFAISGSPALCGYKSRLYLAWHGRGNDDDKIYYASYGFTALGWKWSDQNRAKEFTIKQGAPSLCAFKDRLYMAWRGADDEIWYASFNGDDWSDQQQAGSFQTSDNPTLCAYGEMMYLAWQGKGDDDNKIYYASFDTKAWSERSRAGDFKLSGSPGLCGHDGQLYLAWRGAGNDHNKVYYASFNGSTWSEDARASNFGISSNPRMAEHAENLWMAWQGSGNHDNQICYSSTYRPELANWMRDSYEMIKDHSLKEICIPGAHDASMYMATNCVGVANSCLTQTQSNNTFGMLQAGVRFFDIRPVFKTDGTITTGHYGGVWLIRAGCDGDMLANVLAGVREFLDGGARELVILKFSHYICGIESCTLSLEQMEQLIAQVVDALAPKLFVNQTGLRLADIPFSSLTASQGCVLAVFDQLPSELRGPGIYSYADLNPEDPSLTADLVVYDDYTNTDSLDEMISNQFNKLDKAENHAGDLFMLSWVLTLQGATSCISHLAKTANDALANNIFLQYYAGKITQQLIPNIIFIDYFTTQATLTCMKLNKLLLTGHG